MADNALGELSGEQTEKILQFQVNRFPLIPFVYLHKTRLFLGREHPVDSFFPRYINFDHFFQDLTRIEDLSICRDVLQRHNWNLEVAVQVNFPRVFWQNSCEILASIFFFFYSIRNNWICTKGDLPCSPKTRAQDRQLLLTIWPPEFTSILPEAPASAADFFPLFLTCVTILLRVSCSWSLRYSDRTSDPVSNASIKFESFKNITKKNLFTKAEISGLQF